MSFVTLVVPSCNNVFGDHSLEQIGSLNLNSLVLINNKQTIRADITGEVRVRRQLLVLVMNRDLQPILVGFPRPYER